MKKYILLLSSALFLLGAASCTKFESEASLPVVDAKTPTITLVSAGETDLSVTVAAAEGTGFYSYAVLAGGAKELNATNLLKVKCKGLVEATVNYADKQSVTVTASGLDRNATYTVYAVAASEQGTIGEIATLEILTSDTEIPSIAAFEVADSVVTLAYSEKVTLVEGKTITAQYYAYNDAGFEAGTPVGTVTADMSKAVVEGNLVTVEFAGLPAGAHYSVDIPAGTVKDAVGNLSAEVKSSMKLDASTWETVDEGVCGRRATNRFAFDALDMENLTEWDTPLLVGFGSEYGYGYTLKAAAGKVEYSHTGKVSTIQLVRNTDFGYYSSVGALAIFLPEEPERGDNVTITIAADSFEDLYGNTNEEWTATLIYSYGYTLADVVGDYTAQYTSMLTGAADGMSLSIAAVTEEDMATEDYISGCNVKITTLIAPVKWPLYAHFDVVGGTLTIPSYQFFYQLPLSETQVGLLGFLTISGGSPDTKTPTVLSMPESGVLAGGSSTFGVLVFDAATGGAVSWYAACANFTAQKAAAAAMAPMSLSSAKIYPVDAKLIVK